MNMFEQFIELLLKGIEAGFKFLLEFIDNIITGVPTRNKEYIANFASPGILLSSRQKGFCLTGRRNLSVKESYQNALCIGGTGTGKSSVILIPSLYSMESSFIIHDPSGELLKNCGGLLFQKVYDIVVINPANPSLSSRYNPLARANSSSEIQKVATMLIENALGKGNKDPFWTTQGVALLTILISILKKQDSQFQNLYNVRQLLNQLGANPEGVDAIFTEHADDVLFNEYKAFIKYDEKVVNGVIATCKSALQIFSDESVAHVTSSDNINFQDFRDKPVALFIQNSVADQKYYSVLTSIFFEQFFAYILGRFPKENEQDIFLLIDEASSLNLPTLSMAVANVRKHRAGIMLLLQDFNQLVHLYGKYEADAIKANCYAKMYFTGQSLETTKELEQTLGRYEYEDDKGNKVLRPLMTNDEIRTMKSNHALLICGNNSPIVARLKPYYERSEYREYSLIPVPEIKSDIDSESTPILPISDFIKEDA